MHRYNYSRSHLVIYFTSHSLGEILVNHVGYPVKAVKVFLLEGQSPVRFRVINTGNNKAVYKRVTQVRSGYFGNDAENPKTNSFSL